MVKFPYIKNEFVTKKLAQTKYLIKKTNENIKDLNQQDTKFHAKFGAGYDYLRVKAIQKELVNNGYNIKIDGDWGKQTEAAWKHYQRTKNQKTKLSTSKESNTNLFNFISKWFKDDYPVSTNKNELAISDHKVNSGVLLPYWVLDRNSHLLKHKKGDLTLALFKVMSGLSNYDGSNTWPTYDENKDGSYYNLQKHAMSTPAGIYTLKPSKYDRVPAFRWEEAERGNTNPKRRTSILFHKMPNSRMSDYNKGIYLKSYGCVNLPKEALNYMIKNQVVGDSVYSLPINLSNYIYESSEKGHPLKMQYNDAPKTISDKHYGLPFTLPLTYNTGY